MQPPVPPLDTIAVASVQGVVDGEHNDDHDEHEYGIEPLEFVRIGFVAISIVFSWLRLWRPFSSFDLVAWVATLVGGYPIFKEAFSALRARRMTMELSMTIALAAALAIREAFTALVIVLFVLVAEVLEHLTVRRGRKAIRDLMDFLPRSVCVVRGHGTEELGADSVRAGDVVIVKPGGRIPVDGSVIAGHSFVDQAMISGEALPVEKSSGAMVFAGTVNQTGVLEIRTIGVGKDTAYARIIETVERAEATRAPIQKTADRLAGYLVYFAIGAAVLTFLVTRNPRATISVIIVAGACGIAAGTPLAVLGGIGRSARLGVIIKGGIHLETLGRVDTIVLDKTGTLTLGTPEVVAVHTARNVTRHDVLSAAATAEARSEHPLAAAVLKVAQSEGVRYSAPETFSYAPGRGIVCFSNGKEIVVGNDAMLRERSIVWDTKAEPCNVHVAVDRKYLGGLRITDVARPEAKTAVNSLKAMGLHTVLLTGDAAAIARTIGAELGIEDVVADVLPEQKMLEIRRLQASGHRVAMVGDGINDAPALVQADVGIGMGSGTEVAREAADVVLIGNDLLKLVETMKIATKCRRIIWQNFAGTLAVDGAGVLLAAFGVLNPLLAAFIHVTSELAFILNSTRLLPRGRNTKLPGGGHAR